VSLGGCWPTFGSLELRTVLSLKTPGTTQPMAQSIGDISSLFFASISRKILVTNSELSAYYVRVL